MYIRRVKIQNVRGFKEVDLDFTRPDGSFAGWTVLAGRNGSGKSSFLRALAVAAIGGSEALGLGTNVHRWLREDAERGSVDIELAPENRPICLEIEEGFVTGSRPPGLFVKQERGKPWYLAGYGPYRRLTGSVLGQTKDMPEHLGRLLTLFREDASLLESLTWLREIYLLHLEKRKGAAKLEQDVLELLNDGLLPDGVLVEKIDSDGLWVRQHGVRLPIVELSDGYRTTTALVLDMVRTLHECFGELRVQKAKDDEGEHLRILHEGVVLIDEVDLHLHLRWQQRIGFWLKRHFPKIQFIVTSHSPFVCQAADPKGLIRLPAPGEDRPVEHVSEDLYNTVVNGRVDEVVLTDLFGLDTPYSAQAEELRERVAELEARLQRGKATKAQEKELEELRARLPQAQTTAVEQVLRRLAYNG